MRALIAAAWTIRMRWPMTDQAAASYGEWKHTGRSPGYAAMRPATTGSPSASPGNPEPSTSSERTRASCARAAPGSPVTSASTTAPGPCGCLTSAPTVEWPSSAGKARRSTVPSVPSGAPRYPAGVKPARKRTLAARENGPRGVMAVAVVVAVTVRRRVR